MTTKIKVKAMGKRKAEKKERPPQLDVDGVMDLMADRLPDLTPYLEIVGEGPWVWYDGPELSGEGNKPTRETLKEIGFKFCPSSKHGTWYYWTNIPPKRRGKGNGKKGSQGLDSDVRQNILDMLATA